MIWIPIQAQDQSYYWLNKLACCCRLSHVYELFFPLHDEMPEMLSLHDYHIYWGYPFLYWGIGIGRALQLRDSSVVLVQVGIQNIYSNTVLSATLHSAQYFEDA